MSDEYNRFLVHEARVQVCPLITQPGALHLCNANVCMAWRWESPPHVDQTFIEAPEYDAQGGYIRDRDGSVRHSFAYAEASIAKLVAEGYKEIPPTEHHKAVHYASASRKLRVFRRFYRPDERLGYCGAVEPRYAELDHG